jgi:hypothetical protein
LNYVFFQVEDELASIEREEAANSTHKEEDHKLSKRSRSAIVDLNPSRKQRKRSLETLKQQLYSEIQILEEGDFTGDIEQVCLKSFLSFLLPFDTNLPPRSMKSEGRGLSRQKKDL